MMPNRLLILLFVLLFSSLNFSQFRISQLNSNFDQLNDSLFLDITESRGIQLLNSNWKAYFAENPESSINVSFPSSFTSDEIIIFEKKLELDGTLIRDNFLKLHFLGINYAAEISLNNANLYKHVGGEIPFAIDIPENVINFDLENILRIKIHYSIDSKNTIPLLQRFLFPKNKGGILKDVYLSYRPKVGIGNIEYTLEPDSRPYKKRLNFKVNFEDFRQIVADSLLTNYDGRFKLEAHLKTSNDTSKVYFNIWNINPLISDSPNKEFYVRLRSLYNWSSDEPVSYILNVKLTNGEGYVFDSQNKIFSFTNIEKKQKEIFINDNKFSINGVTLIRDYNNSIDYKQLETDIKTVKEIGFNTIRFSKNYPHPYSLFLCEKYGLFALIDLPLNSIPESFTEDANFKNRAKTFLERTINYYSTFRNVLGYGLGGSYLPNSEYHLNFLSELNSLVKQNSNDKLSYASFVDLPQNIDTDIDLFGLELFGSNLDNMADRISQVNDSDSLVYFISEATYPSYKGATNGYLNKFSFEGQAKFYDDVITLSNNSALKGFIINSMFDFMGDYAPFFSGFNEENIYYIGIFPNETDQPRLSYNLIKSKLKSGSSISIPIGNDTEDAPLIFIIAALIISVIIALLINSKRKFREDATRALLRPYNFFADIRDQRILSGFHSNILMLLLAGSNALLFTIILYYLKNNILFNKVVIAFGNYEASKFIGFLAWNPHEAFIYIYVATIAMFILISLVVHASSFFVKTKVLYSSVYSVLIWAFLPLALLLPLEAILYKLLIIHTYNTYVYIVLILFLIWNIQRFLKGIYVIFDVRPLFVYSYAFLMIIIIISSFGIYYQYTVSAFDYIELAVKQYLIKNGI